VVGIGEFPNDARGHDAVVRWSNAQDCDRVIGIEGAGSYGAGLARHLLNAGEDVYEVPAFLSYRERKKNPSRGKSDSADAVAIARVAARGQGLCSARRTEVVVEFKLLSDHRDQLVRARTHFRWTEMDTVGRLCPNPAARLLHELTRADVCAYSNLAFPLRSGS
jgi:transposase